MDAVSSEAKHRNQLPDLDALDVESLKALVLPEVQLDSRDTEIENLKLLVLKLKRMHFGQRSEKLNAEIEQLELRLEDLEDNQAAAEPLPCQPASIAVNEKAARKPARRPLPAELPREIETIAPRHEACPDCGGTLRPLGEDVSETLEYVPARFKVIRTVRPKLSCACCSRIVQEPAPNRPIDGAWPVPGCWRMCWSPSMPTICRFTGRRRSMRGKASNSTAPRMADWVGGASRTLRPLVEALKRYVLSAEKLHGDDVPVPVLEPGNGKTKTGRLWTYVRDDRPAGKRRGFGGLVRLLAGPQRRTSGKSSEKLSRHPAGRWLCGFQQALRERRDRRGRVLGACAQKVPRSVSGACVAGCERGAGAYRATVRDRERDPGAIAG